MRFSTLHLGAFWLCAALPLAGCGDDDTDTGGFGNFGSNWPTLTDAGTGIDASTLDATSGGPTDAGGENDAGSLDATPSDGGSNVDTDAGPLRDAAATDAQTETDAGPVGDPSDPYAEVRQVCVDTINAYRAGLGMAPLKRATRELEQCSDDGAKLDGDRDQAHYSANMCPGLGAQNTCPGWPVGGRSGTLADALKGCLQLMWDEGEPPQGREACIDAYFNGDASCFLAHGHYLNMSSADNGQVACGFYEMPDGRFWMNQDFGR